MASSLDAPKVKRHAAFVQYLQARAAKLFAPQAIEAMLTVEKYALGLQASGRSLEVINKLADIQGKVELYDATLATSSQTGAGAHSVVSAPRFLPAGLSQWRVGIRSAAQGIADAFLMSCSSEASGCSVIAQKPVTGEGAVLTADKPAEGHWLIVIRLRERAALPASWEIAEARLEPSAFRFDNEKHASGSRWSIPLPEKTSDAQYAAFRIAGTPGEKRQAQGLLVAMTPLQPDAP